MISTHITSLASASLSATHRLYAAIRLELLRTEPSREPKPGQLFSLLTNGNEYAASTERAWRYWLAKTGLDRTPAPALLTALSRDECWPTEDPDCDYVVY